VLAVHMVVDHHADVDQLLKAAATLCSKKRPTFSLL